MTAPVTNDIFARLIAAHPTFDGLKAYLESIGVKTNTKEGDPLVMFRYNRGACDMNNPVVQAFRSVVWDSIKNVPVFVAPQKSQKMDTLPADFSTVVVEDFVDGVMVNLFFDSYKGAWRITTRSRLDADNKFYKHTFAELFLTTWQTYFPGTTGFSQLNPQYGYSFVLQHPLNRIVVPVAQPNLTLVEMSFLTSAALLSLIPSPMMAPRRFAVSSPVECQLLLSNMEQFEGIRSQGIVVRSVLTGQRWKARTNAYVACRKLRGNHNQLEYVWFDNLKSGNLEQYLSLYPEERSAATVAVGAWTKVVSDIYNWYVHVFKVRDSPKELIPPHFRGMLFDLHGQYISRLSKEKKSLDWKEHQLIMAKQDLKRMVFLSTFKEGSKAPPSVQKRQKFAAAKASAPALEQSQTQTQTQEQTQTQIHEMDI
jgi:hypothetical protein